MREKFGVVISVIIALSLLYFIAPMDDLMTLFGKPQNVGEIAGTGISYEDFQNELNTFTTINEITTGSSAQNEQTQKQIQNAAWCSPMLTELHSQSLPRSCPDSVQSPDSIRAPP